MPGGSGEAQARTEARSARTTQSAGLKPTDQQASRADSETQRQGPSAARPWAKRGMSLGRGRSISVTASGLLERLDRVLLLSC